MARGIAIRALQPKRRRAGLEFGPERQEFTGEEFAALFPVGLSAAIALGAILADPLLVVQVEDEDGWRDISPREVDDLHVFLEAEAARVNSGNPEDEAEKARLAAAAAAGEPDQQADAPVAETAAADASTADAAAQTDNSGEDGQPEGADAAAPSAETPAEPNAEAEGKAASNEPPAAEAKPSGRKSKG